MRRQTLGRRGFAAVVRGSSLPTRDIDIAPSRPAENLDRLGRALRRMDAQIRTGGAPVPALLDGGEPERRPRS